MDKLAPLLSRLGYGLYVLTAHEGGRDNGSIINTVMQVTSTPPLTLLVAVNKETRTHGMVERTKKCNISVLTTRTPFSLIEKFGFQSGRDTQKFEGMTDIARSGNGLLYLTSHTNAFLSCEVTAAYDFGTHTVFRCNLTDGGQTGGGDSLSYEYYHKHIKPAPPSTAKGWRCGICGYVYEGDTLPEGFVCPLCKHGVSDFIKIKTEEKSMLNLKGTKTEANLQEAFAGESMARNKYTYFAGKARKDGYEQIAAIFEETAHNEREHAKLWFKHLHGGEVPALAECLKAAAEGENGEWTDMYKRMAAEAREEGFTDLALQFEMVGQIEKEHEERYLKLLDNLNAGKVFAKDVKSVWICRNCGHLHDAAEAPKVCPVCYHGQAYFELRAVNY